MDTPSTIYRKHIISNVHPSPESYKSHRAGEGDGVSYGTTNGADDSISTSRSYRMCNSKKQ